MADLLDTLTLDELRTRTSVKWQAYPADVLPLWVAEMDVPIEPAVIDAVGDAMRRGDTGYPGGHAYADAFADFAAQRWGWTFTADDVTQAPDVITAMRALVERLSGPHDPVVVPSPVYPPFATVVERAGRRLVTTGLTPEGRLDLDDLAQTMAGLDASRAVVLLCNPHNPTGVAHTRDELARVAALAADHHATVVADEIHAPLVLPGATHVPYLTVDPRGYALISASKAWNLAGFKAALAVAGPESDDALAPDRFELGSGTSHMATIAHTAALRHGTGWLDELLAALDGRRTLVAELLAEHLPAVRHHPHQATYLAWLDCRPLGLDDPAATFRDRGRVAVLDGASFGPGGEGFVRLNTATRRDVLTEAVRRMAGAIG
ncbi:cystathionine beta-lyase [Flavimobilis marinus]|uniref:cysteine-S-conjugate beta-lyase n=1 Tax=Flavimobilis marinus TaxID=285351 RepID=A0A1I2HVA0_9MICO|nr:aminotransferase class I/II-fold pyridoxal phosphate-dependent enzyme [Flavimobilis marinus]GHG49346.1 cystathionine beta-lyase [Flavimobilis marinus]SFF33964.1 cystathione beta-lyase [Flavimobilis marinus]